MNSCFSIRDVHYSYTRSTAALNGVTLEIPVGSRLALVGPNGSGKSTLLKILDGLYFPEKGSVTFQDLDVTESSLSDEKTVQRFRKSIGMLFQDVDVQLFSMTVFDEIAFGPLQLGWKAEDVVKSTEQAMSLFGISHLSKRPPHHLSTGEQKKVALASILVIDPQVLLLDEPTAGLDPRTQSVLLDLLHDWGTTNKTIVTSTHDLSILKEICDTVCVLQDGKIIWTGTPVDLAANQKLLESANLTHVHTHKHDEMEHVHPHTHDFHGHSHEE